MQLTWPVRLVDAAGAQLLSVAVPGARLRDLRAAQLDRAVDFGPDVIALLVGLNDLSRGGFDRTAFSTGLLMTVDELRATGALVIVGRLPEPLLLSLLPAALREAVRSRIGAVNAVRQPRPVRLPPVPARGREAQWLLRHGLPWLARHLPQVILPAATVAAGTAG